MGTKLKLVSSTNNHNQSLAIELSPWKILIVDDEDEVHSVTKFALKGYKFADRPLKFFHAYSGTEAKDILSTNDDIALILLDVVMETDHAGLELVEYIRCTLNNKISRIVLRTGQPGQAPEKKIIIDYDINDYKEKTELTSQKLFTLVSASLRSYRDLVALEENRKGLKKIIIATADIFSVDSMKHLAEGALDQLLSILRVKKGNSFYGRRIDALAALKAGTSFEILAGTGCYSSQNKDGQTTLDQFPDIEKIINESSDQNNISHSNKIVNYHKGRGGHENILYVSGDISDEYIDRDLIELYARNVGIVFENLDLYKQIEETQREIVYRLGEAAETRSMETGSHIKRVTEISTILATKLGLSDEDIEIMKHASPLHDVGKLGIPDAILNKPGKLTAEEWSIMQTHSQLGYDMLASSDKPILKAGAIIALEHHEKWDGTGYPYGKSGENIHIFGRITALADVYDALGSKRCYKEAWPLADIYRHIKEQRGKHFQPEIVDALISNIDHVEHILSEFAENV
ncbi:response regulator [Kiloniella majae]|uniref:response regulator n=1 Tax=Kiloniella majae TaxID=1938558 RepID=UPI000A2791C7|nr:response regulator [Kiloniella majae]